MVVKFSRSGVVFIVNVLQYWIYRTAHRAYIADFIYQAAYYAKIIYSHFLLRKASRQRLQPDEVWAKLSFPKLNALFISPTNICNARCIFCAYPKLMRDPAQRHGIMPFEIFKKAVDEYVALGGQEICFTPTMGDALVDPGLLEKVTYARQQAIREVHLYTNGILLAKNELYRRLIDCGVTNLGISMQGCNAEWYRAVYGVDAYLVLMNGIGDLLRYNREQKEPVRITFRFRNAQQPRHILKSPDFKSVIKPYLSRRVLFNFSVDYDNWCGNISQADLKGAMRLRPTPASINVPCLGLMGFFVLFDGSVRLCGCRTYQTEFDELIVGNINTESLADIARGEKTRQIIMDFFNGNRPPACRNCSVYQPVTRKNL